MGIFLKVHDSLKLCLETISSVMKVVLLSKRTESLKQERENALLVLGNGPSLKAFMQDHTDFMEGKDLMMVNFSACSDEYVRLKPKYYLMIDPDFFENREYIEKVFGSIVSMTEWKMVLILPVWARNKSGWKEIVGKNPYVKVVYVNTTPVEGGKHLCWFLYDCRLGMPRPRNVLVACMMQGIWMGYNEIYLAGADHSWMKDLWVDSENRVRLDEKHYYDDEKRQNSKVSPFSMCFWFDFMKVTFRSYMIISEYSKNRNVNIINVTEDSYIDAFDKMKV